MKLLSGLRALDLTNETGFFCGKVLAQLGIDVIKIERPGGDPARNIGPFYHDICDPEKSLYWFAFNEGKRGITLNIEKREGQDIFRKLLTTADFVIESFPVGYMGKHGLSYGEISSVNHRIIVTSITPFGQTGPYRSFKGTDLTAMAIGGIISQNGEPDGIPCRLDPDHTYCLAGSEAALATMIAYYYREWSGEGQWADVSMTECVIRENYHEVPMSWEFGHYNVRRNGGRMFRANVDTRCIWPCKDGHVTWTLWGGKVGASENKQLAKWMDEEGLLGELKGVDWDQFSFDDFTQQDMDRIENHILKLTLRHTKGELEEQAIKRGIRLSPINDVKDLRESSQLRFRKYWKDVEHAELSDVITYPGQLFLSNEAEVNAQHRAPLIGEHNKEIYGGELGFDTSTIDRLRDEGII